MLQSYFGLNQNLQAVLSFHQPLLELVDGVFDLSHLTHKSKEGEREAAYLLNLLDIIKIGLT